MEKKIFLYALFLLSFLSCSSNIRDESAATTENNDTEVEDGNSLLWKIEGDNIKTSYIYGTMHMINEEYYYFPEGLEKRVTNSDAIIMELNGMPNPLKTFQMMSLDSGTVHDYFTQEQLVALLEFMDIEMGVSPQEFDVTYGSMKPFFILQTITQSYFDASAKSHDLNIMALAEASKTPIIGLESIEEQLSFFDIIPRADMAEMIMSSIYDYDKENKEAEKLMKLYYEQKVNKFIPMFKKQSPELMQFSDIFITDRNKKWIPKLEEEMKDKSCFIAVGAGHLFDEDGVIDLLEKKGYELTAISIE